MITINPASQRLLWTDEQKRAAILDLQRGKRWCIACGCTVIDKASPAWKLKCYDCYAAKRGSAFCKACGDPISGQKHENAAVYGKEATMCTTCGKCGEYRTACKHCGVKHPPAWNCADFYSPSTS